ncbi:MAG TPA: hypothetical protein VEF89_13000 [Solirubrobacteraceae bacterium]|nr:hypothetical protein [Solirubrobacteraceae bacterium]
MRPGQLAGLLPEQIDPSSCEFFGNFPQAFIFGNFPQAFSHIGVIAAGITLATALDESREPAPAG